MIFLNWQFEIKIDDLESENAKEIFVIGTPGKIPMSVKVPVANFLESKNEEELKKQIDGYVDSVKNNVKVAFARAIVQELQSIGLIKSDKISAT